MKKVLIYIFIIIIGILIVFFYNNHLAKISSFPMYKYFKFGDSEYPRIFCLILTHPDNINTRTNAVFNAWATKCDNYKFISVIPEKWLNESNVFITNETKLNGFEFEYQNISFLQPMNFTLDRYNKLTEKMYKTFMYLYKNYNDYDYYLKTDDDTFIFVDNLRKFLKRQNRSLPHTYGWDLSCMGPYHSGGNTIFDGSVFCFKLPKLDVLFMNFTFYFNLNQQFIKVYFP